ncbi:hypothetical protein VE03_10123 [Pseudogymnoascus sp. 23342-1-I1]|nr:hypothetical protein VE03_10123 [Pseudogymnoascus sp. 23342-1-I1]
MANIPPRTLNSRVTKVDFICSSGTNESPSALPEPSRTFPPLPPSHLDPIPNNADITARFSPFSARSIPSKPADLTRLGHSAPRPPLESPLVTQGNIARTKPYCCPSVECYTKRDQALRHFNNITEERKATNPGDQLTSKLSNGPSPRPQSKREAVFDLGDVTSGDNKRRYKPSSSSSNPTFRCTFAFAGCNSSFPNKNEWKRHVVTKHICFTYWECQDSVCSSLEQGWRFNRKDLFAQHLRRIHYSEADDDVQKQKHLEGGKRMGKALIKEVRCPVPGCEVSWEGETAWDKRMNHVAMHWERVAKETEEGGWDESGGGLLEWAVKESVVTAAVGGIGWRLVCDATEPDSSSSGDIIPSDPTQFGHNPPSPPVENSHTPLPQSDTLGTRGRDDRPPNCDVIQISSIPTDIQSGYLDQCIAAARSSGLNPNSLHDGEVELLGAHLTQGQVVTYLNIRNAVLRLWISNPSDRVLENEAIKCARDTDRSDAAKVCYEWLVRQGYINSGCVDPATSSNSEKQLGTQPSKTIAIIGAGMSGLSCARQLEGLIAHFGDRFLANGEVIPKVVILEGRREVGGRVSSRLVNGSSTLEDGQPCRVEMGGINISYINQSKILVNQLKLGHHPTTESGKEWQEPVSILGANIEVPFGLLYRPCPLNVRKKTVRKILYAAPGKPSGATIECEDGSTVQADVVVSTIPLGVLKDSSINFEPPLPEWKIGAIQRLGVKNYNNVALVYKEPFWNRGDKFRDLGGLFKWFDTTKRSGVPTIIAVMANATIETESRDNRSIFDEVTQELRSIFGESVPEPVEAIFTRWGKDRFTCGSHSDKGSGLQPGDHQALAKPIGNLFFAGEHTCCTHPATVHGAYISGLRVAAEVLGYLIGPINIPQSLVSKSITIERRATEPGNHVTSPSHSPDLAELRSRSAPQNNDGDIAAPLPSLSNPFRSSSSNSVNAAAPDSAATPHSLSSACSIPSTTQFAHSTPLLPFGSSPTRLRHIDIHAMSTSIQCTFAGCLKNFSSADKMEAHLGTHKRKRMVCPFCDADLLICAFKYHKEHNVCERNKSKKHRCDFCNAGFRSPGALIRHRRRKNACQLQFSGSKPSIALTSDQFAEMNAKLEEAEVLFQSSLAKVSRSTDCDALIKRLKASNSNHKSEIRRMYGVQLRRSIVASPNAVLTPSGKVNIFDEYPHPGFFTAYNED